MKSEDWEQTLQINLSAVFRLSKACLRRMLKQRHGRIINIGSVVGSIGNPGQVHYAAAKAGLIGFTKALAKEVATRNITVNTVAPGFHRDGYDTGTAAGASRAAYLGTDSSRADSAVRRRSPTRCYFWRRARLATSPARRCMSMAACTWAKLALKAGCAANNLNNQVLPFWARWRASGGSPTIRAPCGNRPDRRPGGVLKSQHERGLLKDEHR